MQLFADRFLVEEGRPTIDLATGQRVELVVSVAGGPTEQARWAERCAWFWSIVHPSLAPLVDYGVVGEGQRFEAWGAPGGWAGASSAAQATVDRVSRLLLASGRRPLEGARVVRGVGRPMVVPDPSAGEVCTRAEAHSAGERCAEELLAIQRREDRRLESAIEMVAACDETRLPACALWGPPGGGVAFAMGALARAARLAGCVPLSHRLLAPGVLALVPHRSLVLLAPDEADAGWNALLAGRLLLPRPHMVVFAGHAHVRHVHTVVLERESADALVSSVLPAAAAVTHARRIRTAARRAQGLHERFEQLLFNRVAPAHAPSSGRVGPVRTLRAAEQAESADAHELASPFGGVPERRWPAPGELVRLRRQFAAASALLAAGRVTPGERAVRQVMQAFARRGEWMAAAEAAIALATALQRRGRAADAGQVVADARAWATAAADTRVLQQLSLIAARVQMDAGRAPDAQLILDGVLASAHSLGSTLLGEAACLLAGALFWQGRYADAWHHLMLARPDDDPSATVRWLSVRSLVWLGRERVADAVADAARAREVARAAGDPALSAAAFDACATVQLAAGDAEQAALMAEAGIEAARQSRDVVRTLQLRVLRAEAALRLGDGRYAAVLLRRFGHAHLLRLPVVLRARLDLLRAVVGGEAPAEAVDRVAEQHQLVPLRLLTSAAQVGRTAATPGADDIVALLRCCQAADEDDAVLAALCAHLKHRLRAAGVAVFGDVGGALKPVVSDGARGDLSIAQRAWDAGQLVLPSTRMERCEAGVPVRYAGRARGVLVARWAPGAVLPASDVTILLTTGATAAGPALAGLVARRSAETDVRMPELIGMSPAIAVVRAAVERAAQAPFSVLIEGESGSGKELVARSLHRLGSRRDRSFCAVNCAALPDELVDSELFGHARGAFTGALAERRGVFEEAHLGTLFLDEVGELSPRAQAKLLRTIQEGEIRRVGENSCRRVDVRLVSATHRRLRDDAAEGRFRLDLLYRLDVIRIVVPPLRERRDDIPLLVMHLWGQAASRVGSRATLADATVAALTRYDWPGNVRELQNVLASLAVCCAKRGVVGPLALPPQVRDAPTVAIEPLESARRTFERTFVQAALARAGGRRTRAAEELGVSRQGLAKLVSRLGLDERVG